MALQSPRSTLGSFGTPIRGGLLLLLLSLRWTLPSMVKAADTGRGVMTSQLQRTSRAQQPELTVVLPRALRGTEEKACPTGKEVHVVDEELFFYEEWELEACVSGALLAGQMHRVNAVPFTDEQLGVLKHKLDQFYPQGYPEPLIRNLSYFFLEVTPEDIHKWNVTSLETVKSLLNVSEGRKMDPQVAALIARYVAGGGQLDKVTLDMLASFRPTYLCSLSPEQLGVVDEAVLWGVGPQDLDACRPPQMDVLYHKAHVAFRNLSGSTYFARVTPFLGGASTEDLRALIPQNISMDIATFKKLRKEALLGSTAWFGQGGVQQPSAQRQGDPDGHLGALAATDHCRGSKTSGSKPGGPEGRGEKQPRGRLDLSTTAEGPGQPEAGAPRRHPQRLFGPGPQLSRGPRRGVPPPRTWICVHCDPSSAPGFDPELSRMLWMLNRALLWRLPPVGQAWAVPAPP